MGIEAFKFLKWDGICIQNAAQNPGALNDNPGGPCPQPQVPVLSSAPISEDDQFFAQIAESMSVEVAIVSATPYFSTTKEWVAIRVKIKSIDEVQSFVLQIRDKAGNLVYSERLTQAKLWGLPDAFLAPPPPTAPNQQGKTLATGADSPYLVSAWVTKRGDVTIPLDADVFNPAPQHMIPTRAEAYQPILDEVFGTPNPIDRVNVRVLRILASDAHFAPSRTVDEEKLLLKYETRGFDGKTVKLVVRSDAYQGGAPIYEGPVPSVDLGPHEMRWDGASTCGAGDLSGDKLINPLYSPYKAKLVCDGLAESNEVTFEVLYHSLTIAIGTYQEDPATPPAAPVVPLVADLTAKADIQYLQHRLNELGYFAGPLTGVIDAQTKRALGRYSLMVGGYSPEWGGDVRVAGKANPLRTLMEEIVAGNGRLQVFEDPRCITDSGVSSKVYIDHLIYYDDYTRALSGDHQATLDERHTDPFEVPLEATVLLVSRKQAKGQVAAGVPAGEAAGIIDVQWTLFDPPEELRVPVATENIPTRARDYLTKLHQTTAGAPNDLVDRKDNDPYWRAKDHFSALEPFTCDGGGLAKVHQKTVPKPHKAGIAGTLFKGSPSGGDNFVVQAKVVLPGGREAAVKQAFKDFHNVELADTLVKKTGKMTLWRRRRVAAVVNWSGTGVQAITWNDVVNAYDIAHCVLDTGHVQALAMSDVMNRLAGRPTTVNDFHVATGLTYQDNALLDAASLPAQGPKEDELEYKVRLNEKLQKDLGIDLLCKVGRFVRKQLVAEPAGFILVQLDWTTPITVINRPVLGFIGKETRSTWNPQLFCIGVAAGVTMFNKEMMAEASDDALVAHEMGHNLCLSHHETAEIGITNFLFTNLDNPEQHDQNDHNCTMSYAEGITSRNLPRALSSLKWSRTNALRPRFCGKCVLKLRGWEIRKLLTTSK